MEISSDNIRNSNTSFSYLVASACLAICTFFYLFIVGTYFELAIYPVESRIVDNTAHFHTVIFERSVDALIVVSCAVAFSLFAVRVRHKKIFYASIFYEILAILCFLLNLPATLYVVALFALPFALYVWVYISRKQLASLSIFEELPDKHETSSNGSNPFLFTSYMLVIGVITGAIAILHALFRIVSMESGTGSLIIHNYSYDIVLLLSTLSPAIIFLVVNGLGVKAILGALRIRGGGGAKLPGSSTADLSETVAEKGVNQEASTTDIHSEHDRGPKPPLQSMNIPPGPSMNRISARWKKAVFLSLFMALSILLVAIPQLPNINTENWNVGDDTNNYTLFLQGLLQADRGSEFFRQAFVVQSGGDRPLSLIALYSFVQIVGSLGGLSATDAIEYFPMLLAPPLVISVYFLTRELVIGNRTIAGWIVQGRTGGDTVPLIAAFLTSVSFHLLFGIQGGIYANWLALIVGYLCITFLFRFLKAQTKPNLAVFTALLLVMLLTHVYTWIVLSVVMLIFLLITVLSSTGKKLLQVYQQVAKEDKIKAANLPPGAGRELRALGKETETRRKMKTRTILVVLVLVIASSAALDIGRMVVSGSTSGILADFGFIETGLGIGQFAERWQTLFYTVQLAHFGVLANFIILGLALLWVVKSRLRDLHTIFLMIFLSTGIIPIFIGDWIAQSRTFYDIPFQIPAAIALAVLLAGPRERAAPENNWRSDKMVRKVLLLVAVVLWLVAMAITQIVGIVGQH